MKHVFDSEFLTNVRASTSTWFPELRYRPNLKDLQTFRMFTSDDIKIDQHEDHIVKRKYKVQRNVAKENRSETTLTLEQKFPHSR